MQVLYNLTQNRAAVYSVQETCTRNHVTCARFVQLDLYNWL